MSICGSAPNTDGINKAAVDNAAISKDALDWYKTIYGDQAPNRARAAETAQKVSDAQLRATDFATQQAQDLDAYNKTTFRPLEQKIVGDAQTYDTAGRRMQAAAGAQADIDQSFQATRDATDRDLARSGIAPGSGKALSLMQDAAVQQAAARAGAGTTAIRNVEQQGYARTMDAANLGRNIASNQATQQNIATTTGNSATGNAGAALAATTSGNGLMGQGFTTAINGNNSAGNLFGQAANIEQQQQNAAMQGLGQLGGAAILKFSDKNIKKGTGRMVNAAKALKQIEDTPVETGWSYDKSKGAPADLEDGPKTGPMAQNVRKTMGEAAAPGGKQIDLVTMNGTMMAAIQALSKQVKTLQRSA